MKISFHNKHKLLIPRDDQERCGHRPITYWSFCYVLNVFLLILIVVITLLGVLYFEYNLVTRYHPASVNTPDRDGYRASLYSALGAGYNGVMLSQKPLIQYNNSEMLASDKVIVCYYNVPSNISEGLQPSEIHAHLCTHINVAFANVVNKSVAVDSRLLDTVKQVLRLKSVNPTLKVLLSIGGAGQRNGFIDMVVDHASRKTFIRSIKSTLKIHKLDGVDLDWEFPGIHGLETNHARERQHFSQLLHEIRNEFVREKRPYLLTVAVAAPQVIVDASYDVQELNKYVDFVNIMTYDFHYFTTYTPFTGLNSPLYARDKERYYLATLNINYTVHLYQSKGMELRKIVIGVPTYGHTFKLVNSNNAVIGSPATDFGRLGSMGFVNYPDVCKYLQENREVQITYDEDAKVPFLHHDNQWVSYDNTQSVMEKAKYIKDKGLGGAMIYSLNADDYSGSCVLDGASVRFPLAQSVKNALLGDDL